MKKLILIILILLSGFVLSFGLNLSESMGGEATSLGGIVLDKNLGGANVHYNPSLISYSLDKNSSLELNASYASKPYGLDGLDNTSFGITYAVVLMKDLLKVGVGFGGQMKLVQGGVSENLFLCSLSGTLSTMQIPFLDAASISLSPKIYQDHLDADLSSISGFANDPVAFDMDFDVTLHFAKDSVNIGLSGADLLESSISFFQLDNSKTRGVFVHGKTKVTENVYFYGAYNLTGVAHYVDSTLTASSLMLANTYFGLEAGFVGALYVRAGLNEGRLTGGMGIDVGNLSVNIGILPISDLNLYYQLDVNYKLF